MARALSTPQARFCRCAHFDEEHTENGIMNSIEKKFFLPFNMYILTILSNELIYLRRLVEKKSRKHSYFPDHYRGLPP